MRRDYYVYFHRDDTGNIFYIGKGTGQRAWSTSRHGVWQKYVSQRLSGHYTVEIYREGMSEDEAEAVESQLITEYGEQLVNWVNPRRQFDYQAIEQYHKLRNANRRFVEETKTIEASNPEAAIERYRAALIKMCDYESMTLERGLVADLSVGPDWGDPNILNRLTICLQKLGRYSEMVEETDQYFAQFPSAKEMTIGKQIVKRIEKIRNKAGARP